MKGLREKFRNNKGFTLVEMLIVVAIIAILIMVSIPLVTTTLEKARHAVDKANERNAIALAEIQYLTDEMDAGDSKYYVVDDNHIGELSDTAAAIRQCKGIGTSTGCDTDATTKQALKVTLDANGKASVAWEAVS